MLMTGTPSVTLFVKAESAWQSEAIMRFRGGALPMQRGTVDRLDVWWQPLHLMFSAGSCESVSMPSQKLSAGMGPSSAQVWAAAPGPFGRLTRRQTLSTHSAPSRI